MNLSDRTNIAMLATVAIPICASLVLLTIPAPDVHWVGSANAYTRTARAVLFLSTLSCIFSLYLTWRSLLTRGFNMLAAFVALGALAFLVWALPLVWGVVRAIASGGTL